VAQLQFFTKDDNFTTAVKSLESVKIHESDLPLRKVVNDFLEQIPNVKISSNSTEILHEPSQTSEARADLTITLSDGTSNWVVLVEVKNTGHPSRLTNTIEQLAQISHTPNRYGMLVVPWMSEKLEAACRAKGIGCIDLEGNGLVQFGNVFAHSTGKPPPKQETQGLKSLFGTKATRVLRLMLRDPKRFWRTQTLMNAAEISLGYVHKITSALNERGWLEKTKQGLRLCHPKDLIEAWAHVYTPTSPTTFYSLKHGKMLLETLSDNDGEHWLYASLSAADWLAPLVRQNTLHLVADEIGMQKLKDLLDLKPAPTGFNVAITLDSERDLLRDKFHAAPGIWTTSLLQTYLDLFSGNDRAKEAAQLLFQQRIKPTLEAE
jgi:hypothetical protein